MGTARVERQTDAAATSIAVAELGAGVAFELGMLLDQHDLFEDQIAAEDAHVSALLDGELARRLCTIPGVGPSTYATLIAEIGNNIDRFDDMDHLLAHAGAHPALRSSGRKGADPEPNWQVRKAGNDHLRAAPYRMAIAGVTRYRVIHAHYERKSAAGKTDKTKMTAFGHCMSKGLSLLWGLRSNGQDFDPDWGAPASQGSLGSGRTPNSTAHQREERG